MIKITSGLIKNKLFRLISIGWVRVLLIIIPYYIITSLFGVLGFALIKSNFINPDFTSSTLEDVILMFCTSTGSLIVIWSFVKFIDKEQFKVIGFQFKNRFSDFTLGIGIGAIIMFIGFGLLHFLGEIRIEKVTINFVEIIASIILFLIVAFNEEVIIRGYVLKNFMKSFNKYIALFISAILFTFMHGFNIGLSPISFLNLFLAGILLGTSYIYTQNLWFPIALHFSWNLFQSLFGFNVSGRDSYSIVEFSFDEPNIYNGGFFGFEGSIFSTIILSILIIGILYYYRRKEHNLNTV